MGFLKKYFKKYRKDIFLGQFFKLIEAVLELYMPLVMADLIDTGIKNNDTHYILMRGLLMVGIAVVGVCTALVCQVVASRSSMNFGTELRHDVFTHINSLSYQNIDTMGTPSLITRVTGDINQLQQAMAMLIRLVVRAPFLAIGAIVMAMSLDLQLSVVFIVTTPIIALLIFLVMRKSLPIYRTLQKKLDGLARVSRENLEGARVVRAFSRQESEEEKFQKANEDYTKTAVRVGQLSAMLSPATSVVMNLGIIAVLLMGGQRVQSGFLSQGVIIAFISYLMQILLQISVVANLVILFTKAGASAHRVGELLSMTPAIKDDKEKTLDTNASVAVSFDNVDFAYNQENVLSGINFSVSRGQTVGVIGGTGSGKSTLMTLIPRLYDVTGGSVRVFGHDVKEYPLTQLRLLCALVPQGSVLLRGTIRDNVRWGKKDATDDEIWQALETAQAAEFVKKLPDGLDHKIEENARNLSGGQRQRLTIARAIVRHPKILILDDSSSALDFATDAALRRAIAQLSKDMTVFIISQRAGSIKYADEILVMDDGTLVGRGTHTQLMDSCEVYREICLSQLSEKEAAK